VSLGFSALSEGAISQATFGLVLEGTALMDANFTQTTSGERLALGVSTQDFSFTQTSIANRLREGASSQDFSFAIDSSGVKIKQMGYALNLIKFKLLRTHSPTLLLLL
jgi:hypothetical protein